MATGDKILLKQLPLGIQSFPKIRSNDLLYVDKTGMLLELARRPGAYFLARPRRFGKSLTVSTLEAMFSGKAELFKSLAAEEWVRRQGRNPNPVPRLDLSHWGHAAAARSLNRLLQRCLTTSPRGTGQCFLPAAALQENYF